MGIKTEFQNQIFNAKLAASLIEHDGNYAATWKALHPDKTYSSTVVASNACGNYLTRNKKDLQKIFHELLFKGKNSNLQVVADELSNQIKATKEVVYNAAGHVKEVKDNQARLDAIKTTLKIVGIMADKESNDVPGVQINIGTMDINKLDTILNKLNSLRDIKQTSEVIDIEPLKLS